MKQPHDFALCVEAAPSDATTMLAAPRQRSRAALAQRSHDFSSGDHASAARVAWCCGDCHIAESASESRSKIPRSASLARQSLEVTEKTRGRAGVLGCTGKDTD